jgi:hypothetical protein
MSYELNARSSPAPSCGPGGTSTRVARLARAGRAGVPTSCPARNRIARDPRSAQPRQFPLERTQLHQGVFTGARSQPPPPPSSL